MEGGARARIHAGHTRLEYRLRPFGRTELKSPLRSFCDVSGHVSHCLGTQKPDALLRNMGPRPHGFVTYRVLRSRGLHGSSGCPPGFRGPREQLPPGGGVVLDLTRNGERGLEVPGPGVRHCTLRRSHCPRAGATCSTRGDLDRRPVRLPGRCRGLWVGARPAALSYTRTISTAIAPGVTAYGLRTRSCASSTGPSSARAAMSIGARV